LTVAAALATLKTALGPKSEREIISTSVAAAFGPGTYRWLDVGMGDGVSLSRILTSLATSGVTFEVTGIDPEMPADPQCPPAKRLEALKCLIEEYEPQGAFDVINVRQSAHYFRDPSATLSSLSGNLSIGGVLAVTHWTEDCFLFQLHGLIAEELGVPPSAVTLGELISGIKIDPDRVEAQTIVVVDTIDLGAILRDIDIFNATLSIAARRLPLPLLSKASRASLASRIDTDWPKIAHRANGVLLLTPLAAPKR
jgi:SAM-dependent methyltransferase